MLDVGCGAGLEGEASFQREIAARAGRFWGVEPGPDAPVEAALFDRVWRTTLQRADVPPASVDVAYSCMVAEHLLEPVPHVRKLCRVLKPGGRFLMLTINDRSCLGRVAALAYRLRVQERLLWLLHGKARVAGYHHPAPYRFNRAERIAAMARRAGFRNCRVAFLENGEATDFYFPSALRWVGRTIDWTHKVLRRADRFTNLIVVLRK